MKNKQLVLSKYEPAHKQKLSWWIYRWKKGVDWDMGPCL